MRDERDEREVRVNGRGRGRGYVIGRARHTASSLAPARLACPTHSQVRPHMHVTPHTPRPTCACATERP